MKSSTERASPNARRDFWCVVGLSDEIDGCEWLYLAIVLDLYAHKVVAWAMAHASLVVLVVLVVKVSQRSTIKEPGIGGRHVETGSDKTGRSENLTSQDEAEKRTSRATFDATGKSKANRQGHDHQA
jgi:hypothetical protein